VISTFGLLGFVGYKTRRLFEVVADISAFSLRTLRGTLDFHQQGFWTSFEVVVKQVYFTGLEAIPFLTLVSLILGSVVIIQSLPQLIGVGAQRFIGTIIGDSDHKGVRPAHDSYYRDKQIGNCHGCRIGDQ